MFERYHALPAWTIMSSKKMRGMNHGLQWIIKSQVLRNIEIMSLLPAEGFLANYNVASKQSSFYTWDEYWSIKAYYLPVLHCIIVLIVQWYDGSHTFERNLKGNLLTFPLQS